MPSLADAEVEEATSSVLAGAPFSTPDRFQDVLLRMWQEIQDRLIALSSESPFLYWAMVLGVTAVAIVLLWHIAVSVRQALRALRAGPASHAGPGEAAARFSLSAARAAAASGDFQRAVELAYDAAAAQLSALNRIPRAGCSPRAHHRKLCPTLSQSQDRTLGRLVAVHEQACYSGAATDAGLADEAMTLARQLCAGGAET